MIIWTFWPCQTVHRPEMTSDTRHCCMCLPLPHQDRDSYHSGEESFANIQFGCSYVFTSFHFSLCHFDSFHIILCHFISFHVISYHFISFLSASLYPIWWHHEKRYYLIFVRRETSQLYHLHTYAFQLHFRYSWWINWDISLVRQILKQGAFISINIIYSTILHMWWCHLTQVKFRHTSRSGWNISYSRFLTNRSLEHAELVKKLMANSANFTQIVWKWF